MEGQSDDASDLLVHAACGVPLAAEAGLLSRLLLSSGGVPTVASTYELQPSAICRVILHAGASVHQLQHLLEEVQSAGLLCPAVVPPLLEALLPQHRQELSFRLTQLRQQYIDYQQQEPQDGVLPNPAAAEAFVQHLQQLTSVDVLLMTSIASQQWQADVSFVLMQGVTQTPSLQQLGSLFQELSATSDAAADWLLDVGLNWCRTCHLDLPQGFEAAGVRLLQAAVRSKPQLSATTLQRVVKQLLAESAPNSHYWAVLQYTVQQCCHRHSSHQHQQQQQGMQSPLQPDRPARAGAVAAGAAAAAAAGDFTSALAAVCEQELLAGLTAVMSRLEQQQDRHVARVQSAQTAVRYCSTIAPLAAVSCDVLQALLQCAVDAVRQHQGLPLHARGLAAAVKVEEECLPSQQQEQQQQSEGSAHPGHYSSMIAAGAAAGGGGASGDSIGGRYGVVGSGSVSRTPGSGRKKPRYSWGLNQRPPVPAFSSPAAAAVSAQGPQQGEGVSTQQQQQQQQQLHEAGASAGADHGIVVASQQLHLSEPQQQMLSPGQSHRSHHQGQEGQQADHNLQAQQQPEQAESLMLGPGDAAAQVKQQLQLLRSLQGQRTSSHAVQSAHQQQAGVRWAAPGQLPSAAVAAAADLPPYERLAVAAAADALAAAAWGEAGLCSSTACQVCVVSLLQELLAGLSAAATQQLSEAVAHVLQQQQQQGQRRQCRSCNRTQPLLPPQQPQDGAAQQPCTQGVSSVAVLWYQAVLQQLQSVMSASLQAAAAAAAAAPGSAQELQSRGGAQAGCMPINFDAVVPVLLGALAAKAQQVEGSSSSSSRSRSSHVQDAQLHTVLAQLLLLLLMASPTSRGAAPPAVAAGLDGACPAAVDGDVAAASAEGAAGNAVVAPAAAAAAPHQAASEAVKDSAARVEQLLLHWHAQSLLLSWLLQDAELAEAVAKEVAATAGVAAAAGASSGSQPSSTLPAAPPTLASTEAAAAAAGTGLHCNSSNTVSDADVRKQVQPALENAVLQLQQLQQWHLPAALRQLAQLHTAAVQQQQAAEAAAASSQQIRLDAYGGRQDQGGGLVPGSNQKKRMKHEGGFFVIKRTPAAAAAATSPTKPAAAAARGAVPGPKDSTAAVGQDGVKQQQQGQQTKARQRLWQLPLALLQPPEPLGMQACVRLLGAACSSIQDAQAALQQQRQQLEQQQGQLVGATPNSRRHSSRLGSSPAPSAVAAAQAAGGVVGSVPDTGSGTAAGQHPPGADEAAAAGAAAAGGGAEVTAAGILSAAAASAVGTSGSRGSNGSAAQLAMSLQQAMHLSQLAVASILEASKVHTHQQQQLQQEQQKHEHCLHAVVLLLELARLCRVGTAPIQQQQLSGLACSCVGAAAELLETWWDQLCTANSSSSGGTSSLHEAVATAAQQLQPLLLPGSGHDRVAGGSSCSSGATRRSSGAVGGSTAELFGVQYSQVLHVLQLGPSGWAHTCKVAQQEPLVGLLLVLSCQVDDRLSQLDKLCQEAACRQHSQQTAAAAAAEIAAAAAQVTAHVKLLAVLRKIAESVYAAAALAAAGEPASQHETLTPAVAGAATAAVAQSGRLAGGGGGGSSKALWLLGALDHWLLELAVGFSLDPCIASLPKAASACARHALLLSTTCRPPRRSSSNSSSLFSSPTLNTARLVHCMCLHYSPRVYLAGSVGAGRVWGRGGGLEAGPGKGPAWVLSLSRQAAADMARQTLTFLTHKLTGSVMIASPAGSLGSSQGSLSSGVGGTVLSDVWGQILAAKGSMEAVAAGSEGLDIAAVQGLLNWLCEQAATVATVCSCVELLLGCRTAAAKVAAKARRQQWPCLGAEDKENPDAVAREARAVFAALTAVLSGPCSAAVAALRQQLCTMQQQEERQGLQAGVDMQQALPEPAAEQQQDTADAIAAAAAAAAAALAGEEAAAAAAGPEALSLVSIMAAAEVGDVGRSGLGQPQDQEAAAAAAAAAATEAAALDPQLGDASDAVTPTPVKRGRGRPRKYPLVSPPAPASTGPKRGRGRPRKDSLAATAAAAPAAADILPQDAAAEAATELAPAAAAGDDFGAVADSTPAAAADISPASQPAATAAGEDSTGATPASASHAVRHRNSSVSKAAAKQQQLLAARALEAAKKLDACQEMLCVLAGMGVAVGELLVRMFDPQRQQQQGQHNQSKPEQQLHGGSGTAGGCGAAAGVWVQALQQQQQQQQQPGPDLLQQLQQQLRAWPAEWQALQADLAAARSNAQQESLANTAAAAAMAQMLEDCVQLCRVQRRKDAWEAVRAAAAAADAADDSGSEAEDPDSPARPPRPGSAKAAGLVGAAAERQDSRQAQLGVSRAAQASAAAAAAARFCDPDVREELPYIFGVLTSDDEDDQPLPAAAAGGGSRCTAAPAADSSRGTAANGVGACDGDALDGFRTPARRILSVAAPGSSARATAAGADGGLAALAKAAAAAAAKAAPGSSGGFKTPASVPPRSKHSAAKPPAAADMSAQLELEATIATLRPAQRTSQQQQQCAGAGNSTPGTAAAALAAAKRAAAAAQLARSGTLVSPEGRSAAPASASSQGAAAAAAAVTPMAGMHKQAHSNTKQAQRPAHAPTPTGQQQQQQGPTPALSPVTAQQHKGKLSAGQQQLRVVDVFCAGLSAQYDAAQNMVGLQDGTWVTPTAFEKLAGKGSCKNWKKSVLVRVSTGQGDAEGDKFVSVCKWLSGEVSAAGVRAADQQQQGPLPGSRARKREREQQQEEEEEQTECGVSEEDWDEQQQQRVTPAAKKSRLANNGSAAKQRNQQQQQQHSDSESLEPESQEPVRNSFIAACLNEARRRGGRGGGGGNRRSQRSHAPAPAHQAGRGGGSAAAAAAAATGCSDLLGTSDDEEGCEGEDDYSDLEDFIVCEPSTDYSKLLSRLGKQVSWRHCWRGAGKGRH